MSLNKAFIALAVAAGVGSNAQAVTIDISQSASFSATTFNVIEQTVVLPAGFSDALINIISVNVNDAAVLQVNGVNIVGWGIFGPGNGTFAFNADGPFVPFTYSIGVPYASVSVNQSYAAPLVVGNNSIKLFHNDNGNGITGNQFHLNSGLVQMNANISFTSAVPEPETYAMLLAGLGLIGAAVKRRKAK